jgi:hypothetical protein
VGTRSKRTDLDSLAFRQSYYGYILPFMDEKYKSSTYGTNLSFLPFNLKIFKFLAMPGFELQTLGTKSHHVTNFSTLPRFLLLLFIMVK